MVRNLERTLARLRAIPDRVRAAAGVALENEVRDLVEAEKRVCPRSLDDHGEPSHLADSIHYQAPRSSRFGGLNGHSVLSFVMIADARDSKGRLIGASVEHGHIAANGTHVPGAHFWFAVYRARKRAMRRRLLAATRRAFKAA